MYPLQKEEDIDLYRIFCHIREIPQTAQDELRICFAGGAGRTQYVTSFC